MTEFLLRLHRWAGLVLAPLFAVILLSGGVLALEPILGQGDSRPRAAVDVAALTRLLERNAIAQRAAAVEVEPDGATVALDFGPGTTDVRLEIATGATRPEVVHHGLFDLLHDLHETLLLDAKIVVESAAWAMLAILITGPLLAWPRLRNTLSGWHLGVGWILLPLVLLPAATAALRTTGVGDVPRRDMAATGSPLTPAEAVVRAAATVDLSMFDSARRRDGGVLLRTGQGAGSRAWQVTANGVQEAGSGRNWPRELHDGLWAPPYSGWVGMASACALLGLLGTGSLAWVRRWRASRQHQGDADADLLVAHASQTGTAARYAEATAAALRSGGARVAIASLAAIRPADLARYRAALLVVSTTGEGQVAEPGRAFLRALDGAALDRASFAVLALGDRRYPDFCAGGEALRTALLRAGAIECVPIARADADPAEAWQAWLASLAGPLRLRLDDVAQPEPDRTVALRLARRTRLDDPAHGETREVHALELESAMPMDWRPGDLLLVSPGADQPERCYSIGSTPRANDRRLLLTVALSQSVGADGKERPGAASGLLCRTLRPGATIPARLRRHAAFNPPDDPRRAIIMIATGCGIAPFIGFLAEREAAGSCGASWLVFGNRYRAGDFLHGERLRHWAQDGVLARLDTAFSRDVDDGAYVQDRLLRHAAEVWDWMARRNAILYVCGGRSTLGRTLDEALLHIAMAGGDLSPAAAEATLERWLVEGRIRRDIID
jgi:sulfite reductase (NADPH) flavoprotein alpha-component